jgi:hypothetical protein
MCCAFAQSDTLDVVNDKEISHGSAMASTLSLFRNGAGGFHRLVERNFRVRRCGHWARDVAWAQSECRERTAPSQ